MKLTVFTAANKENKNPERDVTGNTPKRQRRASQFYTRCF